jgi:molecular chaperone HtpG
VAKGDLDLSKFTDAQEKKEQEKEAGEYKELIEKVKAALGETVKEVRATFRLTDSAACLVADEHGMSMNLERLLRSAGQKVPAAKPTLEINPRHPLVQRLKFETDDARFKDWSHILFDQALLAEGGQLDDPAAFVKRLNQLMVAMTSA